MWALGAEAYGGPEQLSFHRLALPEVSEPGDVLVRVEWAELNPVDCQKLAQKPEGTPVPEGASPFVVGWGAAGLVQAVGGAVEGLRAGDRVAFLQDARRRGCYATHSLVDRRLVAKVPDSVSLRDAASLPLSALTAYEALFEKLRIGDPPPGGGERRSLLVIGAAGGVGSWALQLARRQAPSEKLRIVATASTPSSADWCRGLGADEVVPHDGLRQLGGGPAGSIDYVLALFEPANFADMAEVLRPFGRICLVTAGSAVRSLDLSFVFFKGGTVSTEAVFAKARAGVFDQGALLQQLLGALADGSVRAPLAGAEEPVEEHWGRAAKRLKVLAGGHGRGKLVMRIPDYGDGESPAASL